MSHICHGKIHRMRIHTVLPIMGTTVKWSEGRLWERCSNSYRNRPWIQGKRLLGKKGRKLLVRRRGYIESR